MQKAGGVVPHRIERQDREREKEGSFGRGRGRAVVECAVGNWQSDEKWEVGRPSSAARHLPSASGGLDGTDCGRRRQ